MSVITDILLNQLYSDLGLHDRCIDTDLMSRDIYIFINVLMRCIAKKIKHK